MATKAQIAKQIEELQAQMEEAPEYDDSEEVWVRTPEGYETKLTGEKARRFLDKHRKLWDDEEETPIKETIKKSPAKKAVAKKVIKAAEGELESLDEDLDDSLEEDEKPATKSFWG